MSSGPTEVPGEPQNKRLDSWKEIAEYLGRDVRTAVRWEKEKGLPVRRLPGGKRQSVFAFPAEIDAWLRQHDDLPEVSKIASSDSADLAESSSAVLDESSVPPRASKSVLLGVAALVAVVLLVWLFVLWTRKPAAVPTSAESSRDISIESAKGTLRFVASSVETGIQAYQFVAADLNSDGKLDIAFSSTSGDADGVLLGKGDGTFQPAQVYEGCRESFKVIVADFNRDGHADIAASCAAGNNVAVLWGKGDGTFPDRTEIPVPGGPRYLVAGDLNGDGWPDLVVSSFGEPALYILLNHAGRFESKLLSRYEGAAAIAVSDVNGDGRLDLIASVRIHDTFGLNLFWGKGDGSFQPENKLLVWNENANLAIGVIEVVDLNGDGLPDIIYSIWNRNVLVSRGLSRGKFGAPVPLPGTSESGAQRTFALCDLDQDRNLDVIVSENRVGTLGFHRGNGDGTFASAIPVPAGNGKLYFPVVADFNGDGLPDILVNNYFEKNLELLTARRNKLAGR